MILEVTSLDGAVAVGERIRNEVLRLGIPTERNQPLAVSIGVAARWPGEGVETLLRRADRALYTAKNAGRNRDHRRPTPNAPSARRSNGFVAAKASLCVDF